ncbi:2-hydroxyhepta-2,4-diene-1,7-dioate isomerase [Rhodobacterales bacterium HKCCE2091]|nr:2-hydroxyhepta-2,4-diene-1,7-dioate isomerase [Rhodobacterales bacterium HKCCE2091]
MRFLRYGPAGAERPGVLDSEGRIRDLGHVISDFTPDTLSRLADLPLDGPVVPGTPRIGAPVPRPGKIVCIGRNYAEHAAETGNKPPPEPMIFMKASSAQAGPFDPIPIPRGSVSTDYEAELAIVIGHPAKHVAEADALGHVAGYMAMNDLSERDWQWHRAGQYTKGKSCDGFAPMGPWLVTPDEAGDPQAMRVTLSVNGQPRQDGTTADMIFGAAYLVSYLSDFFTLEPGDVIATGTPSGVGAGMDPPGYLRPGDRLRLEIGGLGAQEAEVIGE